MKIFKGSVYMPSYVTHIIFGQNVLSKLEKIGESSSAAIIKSNQVAFCWGAQGPDILFFRDAFDKKRVSNLGDYGALMHKTKTNELLSALVDIIGSSDATDAEKAYIYGFSATMHWICPCIHMSTICRKSGAPTMNPHFHTEFT